MRIPIVSSLLALLLILFLAFVSQAEDKPAEPKGATTPDEAVKLLAEASKGGDIEGFLAHLVGYYRAAMQSTLEAEQAREQLVAALDDKFGKTTANPKTNPTMKEELMALKAMEIVEKGAVGMDKVILKIKVTTRGKGGEDLSKEVEWTALKETDGWKLLPPNTPDPKVLDVYRERMARLKAVTNRIKEEVKEGKYKTREEAEKAFKDLAPF